MDPKDVLVYNPDKDTNFCVYKLALIVRQDIGMGKGKIAGQCGHACIMAYQTSPKDQLDSWLRGGQTKIVLKGQSEDELLELYHIAKEKGMNVVAVRDSGRTQIEPNTLTVLAIGPDTEERLNPITGKIK
jgi:PTH2 family peptidyl-tRNA hydrolase